MTKTIAIALVAAIGFVGTADAASYTMIRKAQGILNDYNFSVDASTLTDHQLARFHFIDDDRDVSAARVRAQIRSILRSRR